MDTSIDFDRYDRIRPIRWIGDALELLDQRKLPFDVEYAVCRTSDEVAAAIHALTVRGAPAIGIAAAWGVVLAARAIDAPDGAEAAHKLEPALLRLNAARPTAVNLAWALARMRRVLSEAGPDWRNVIEREARAVETEDLAANRHMGMLDEQLVRTGAFVTGDDFTLADVVLGLSAQRWKNAPIARAELHAVAAYLERLSARPGFAEFVGNGMP